jgi:hypothetical protein
MYSQSTNGNRIGTGSARRNAIGTASRAVCEALERRAMFCALHGFTADEVVELRPDLIGVAGPGGPDGGPAAVINWVNDGDDDDGFEDVFGARAEDARKVVREVIEDFQEMIGSFNYADGSATYRLTVNMNGGNGNGASANLIETLGGKPQRGRVSMGRGADGLGSGWFIDPTPEDSAEFQGNIVNAFAADAQAGSPAAGLGDFYTVVAAELTHCLGLFGGTGMVDSWDNLTTDTGIADTAEGGGTGNFWVFQGPSIRHLMTGNNAGPGGSAFPGAVHSAGPGVTVNFGGFSYQGAQDIGNAIYELGRRYLVNNVFSLMFRDAYDYGSVNPDQFATMYANLNRTTGALLVRGGLGTSADEITVSRAGSTITVSVNVGSDIPGTGALPGAGNLPAFVTEFTTAEVSSITISTGDGADIINLDSIDSATPITINGEAGNDRIYIGNGDVDSNVLANVLVNGGSGSDTLTIDDATDGSGSDSYTISRIGIGALADMLFDKPLGGDITCDAAVEAFNVVGSPQADAVAITGTASAIALNFNSGGGDDTVEVGAGDYDNNIAGHVSVVGGAGTDLLIIDDSADAAADSYTLEARSFAKSSSTATLSWTNVFPPSTPAVEELVLNANGAANTINLNGLGGRFTPPLPDPPQGFPVNVTLNGNAGNDTINIGGGDYDGNMIGGGVTVNGGDGIDRVAISDAADTGSDAYQVNALSFTKNSSAIVTSWENLLPPTTPAIEEFVLSAGTGANTINLNGLGGVWVPPFPDPPVGYPVNATLNGGAGNDTFVIAASEHVLSSLRGNVTVEGQADSDHLLVSDTSDTGADSFTLTSTGLTNSDWSNTLAFGTVESLLLDANNSATTVTVASTFDGDISIDGNGGADTINVSGNFAARYVTVEGGAGLDTVNVNDDAVGTARVAFASTQDLAALHVFTGGSARVNSGGNKVLVTQSLAIDGSGTLDLTDEDVIVDYAGASPLATIQALLTAGYNAGAWNGSGAIISSSAAAAAAGNTGVGFAEATDIFTVFPATFAAQAVDNTAVLLKYTLYGDANLDGQINLSDYNRLASNFGQNDRRWSHGDSDYNGHINLNDYNRLAINFGLSGFGPPDGEPEDQGDDVLEELK